MSKLIAILGVGGAALLLGVGLLAYSPSGCACLDPVQELAVVAGLGQSINNTADLTSKQIESGLNVQLRAQTISLGTLGYTEADGCWSPKEDRVICRYALLESALLAKGFEVTYHIAPDFTFQKASVSKFTGLRP